MTTQDIQRHYEGLIRFGKDYIKENGFTAGNLMELLVYVEGLIAPHYLRILDMVELELKENPKLKDGGEQEQLVFDWQLEKYKSFHPEAQEQANVHSLINDELHELRHRQEALVRDKSLKLETTRQRVEGFFEFLTGWDGRNKPRILSESDFKKLVDWVAFYCENDFTPPIITQPIYHLNTTKGIIIHAFKKFFKIEFPGYQFPDSLFKLIKACFYELRNDNIENLKKTKEPVNYRKLQKYNG